MRLRRLVGAIAVLLGTTTISAADALDSARRFFNDVRSYSAQFQQTVWDESKRPIQESTGRLWLERPNKFRWNYDRPPQQIVSDGERVWVYDEELQQISVRSLSTSLTDTPALLLTGRGRLEDAFTLKPLPATDELEWVELTPRRKEGAFDVLRLAFAKGKIRIIEMVDGLGHTTRYTLQAGAENVKIDAGRFRFVPPQGVDIVTE